MSKQWPNRGVQKEDLSGFFSNAEKPTPSMQRDVENII